MKQTAGGGRERAGGNEKIMPAEAIGQAKEIRTAEIRDSRNIEHPVSGKREKTKRARGGRNWGRRQGNETKTTGIDSDDSANRTRETVNLGRGRERENAR